MKRSHAMETIFPLILFGIFAIMSLFLVIIGSDVYSKIVTNSNENGEVRTSISYIANKLRSYDSQDCTVYVTEVSGIQALVLEDEYNGCTYQNLIYFYEDSIREVLIQKGWEFNPEYGEFLIDASGFWVECMTDKKVVSFTVANLEGKQQTMEITYRSGDIR